MMRLMRGRLLIEDGKAQVVDHHKTDCREWLTVLTLADELFDIVKPDVSDVRLAQLWDMARAVLDEEKAAGAFSFVVHAE